MEETHNWLADILQRESCAQLTGTMVRIINEGVREKLSNLHAAEHDVVRQLSLLPWESACPPRGFFVVTYRTVAVPMTVARWLVLAGGGLNGLLVWPSMVRRLCTQFPTRICHPVGGWVVLALCMYNHTLSIPNHRDQASKFLQEFGNEPAFAPLLLESEDNALELYDAAFVMFHRMLLTGTISDAMWDSPEPDDEIAISTDDEVPSIEYDRYFA